MLLTIIVFILMLGLLIFVHELGHFIVAKIVGVKVEEFALGFPPRLFSKKIGETEYSINLLPLGGYVKMLGELEHSKDKRAFENQKPRSRFFISIAGVVMNLVLAWLILTIGFSVGMSPIVSSADSLPGNKISSEIIIADVMKNSPAEKIDLKQEDIILNAKDKSGEITSFTSLTQFNKYTENRKNQTITLNIKRDGRDLSKEVTISSNSDAPLGVSIIENAKVKVAWYKAPYVALREVYEILKLTFVFLGGMVMALFKTHKVSEGVGGPVAIYTYTGLAVKAGFMVLMQFVSLLSINLALINILPFPALDGGRLVFIVLERIYGKKIIKENVENIIHTIGFGLLILLMIIITYRDVINLVHK